MTQVCVVGAGVIGASVAYYLTQRGLKPVVVDAVGPACAASGKAGGFLARDWSDGSPSAPLAHESFALHTELAEKLDGKNKYGYRRVAAYSVSIRPGKASERPAGGRRLTSDLTWLNQDNLVESTQIGDEESCAQLHPARFTKTLLEEVTRAGGSVRVGRVTGIKIQGGQVYGVKLVDRQGAPCGFVSADVVAHSVVVRDVSAGAIPAAVLFLAYRGSDGKSQEPEVYPRPDGEVYICGGSSSSALPDYADEVAPDEGTPARLREIGAAVSPFLEPDAAETLAEQACFLPCSPTGLPVIGAIPGVKGAFVAAGHSVWGILNAPVTGLAIAELIVDGHTNVVPLQAFDPALS
ncbi:hypothetical protein QBZ16_003134 [Prototheca wickerhamii]|uniref:FAD dependent oxidoreductase domain-containing protein n=1 Tax=Prototheca wickerhamii TaxID=3111 RepID=A0AAD9MJ70_PROWI|nr:hypothetical protein QBZ16_003134 [Prototheca wickerhamii]